VGLFAVLFCIRQDKFGANLEKDVSWTVSVNLNIDTENTVSLAWFEAAAMEYFSPCQLRWL